MKNSPKSGKIRPQRDWAAIRRDWQWGELTIKQLAAKHKLHPATIYRRAAAEEWPARGERPEFDGDHAVDPLSASKVLYADLTAALREALAELRYNRANASTRTAEMIRAHRRSLAALLEAQKTTRPSHATQGGQGGAPLDLGSARAEILARLDALAA